MPNNIKLIVPKGSTRIACKNISNILREKIKPSPPRNGNISKSAPSRRSSFCESELSFAHSSVSDTSQLRENTEVNESQPKNRPPQDQAPKPRASTAPTSHIKNRGQVGSAPHNNSLHNGKIVSKSQPQDQAQKSKTSSTSRSSTAPLNHIRNRGRASTPPNSHINRIREIILGRAESLRANAVAQEASTTANSSKAKSPSEHFIQTRENRQLFQSTISSMQRSSTPSK